MAEKKGKIEPTEVGFWLAEGAATYAGGLVLEQQLKDFGILDDPNEVLLNALEQGFERLKRHFTEELKKQDLRNITRDITYAAQELKDFQIGGERHRLEAAEAASKRAVAHLGSMDLLAYDNYTIAVGVLLNVLNAWIEYHTPGDANIEDLDIDEYTPEALEEHEIKKEVATSAITQINSWNQEWPNWNKSRFTSPYYSPPIFGMPGGGGRPANGWYLFDGQKVSGIDVLGFDDKRKEPSGPHTVMKDLKDHMHQELVVIWEEHIQPVSLTAEQYSVIVGAESDDYQQVKETRSEAWVDQAIEDLDIAMNPWQYQ